MFFLSKSKSLYKLQHCLLISDLGNSYGNIMIGIVDFIKSRYDRPEREMRAGHWRGLGDRRQDCCTLGCSRALVTIVDINAELGEKNVAELSLQGLR